MGVGGQVAGKHPEGRALALPNSITVRPSRRAGSASAWQRESLTSQMAKTRMRSELELKRHGSRRDPGRLMSCQDGQQNSILHVVDSVRDQISYFNCGPVELLWFMGT